MPSDDDVKKEIFVRMKAGCSSGLEVQSLKEKVIESYSTKKEKDAVESFWDEVLSFQFIRDGGDVDFVNNKFIITKCPKSATRAPTKSVLRDAIAMKTGLSKTDVKKVLDAFQSAMSNALSGSGPGEFTVPTFVKIKVKRPADAAPEFEFTPLSKLKKVLDS